MDDKLNNYENDQKNEQASHAEERKKLDMDSKVSHPVFESSKETKKVEFSNIFADILIVTKKWFSRQPLSAFSKRLDIKTSLSLLASHLFISMFIFFLSFNSVMAAFDGFGFLRNSNISARMFLPILIVHLIYYALLALTIMVIAKIIKTPKNTYTDALSLVSIALIPVTILALVSLVIGVVIPQLIPVFFILQLFAYLISLYMGLMVHLGKSEKSPFWIFPIAMIIMLVVFMLVLTLITRTIVTSQMNSLNNNLRRNLFNGF